MKLKMLDTTTLTANGSTPVWYPSQMQTVVADGTFDGGTLKAELTPDNGTTYQDISDGSLTEDGHFNVTVGKGMGVRMTLSGATSPSINVWSR